MTSNLPAKTRNPSVPKPHHAYPAPCMLHLLCLLGLNLLLISSSLFERLPVNAGLGWDGVRYATITRNFAQYMASPALDGYYVQRILPCGVVFALMWLLGLAFSDSNIVFTF